MEDLFEAFIKDRRYGKGVSVRTEGWYRQSWHAFRSAFVQKSPDTISRSDFSRVIEGLCERGVSPITINTYSRAVNAFLHWLHAEERCPRRITIQRLKEPETIVRTFQPEHVRRLMQHRATCRSQWRAQVIALTILDTGIRLSEALSLRTEDLDFDNLLITIRYGKGGKQRIVPLSAELRRILFKYIADYGLCEGLVFRSRDGGKVLQRNTRREFDRVCSKLNISGVKGGFHVLRHTFAVNYIRYGGDVFRLQRVLGHSTLEMTRRYVDLQTADLQAVHSKLSLLSRRA